MAGSPFKAIAYVKAEVPDDDPDPVIGLDEDDAPVLKKLGHGLLVTYLVDERDRFSYVQGRDLRNAGIDEQQLHAYAVKNLEQLAEGRVTIRTAGQVQALFFDGNFEASLILLDEMWDDALRSYHSGAPVIAIPSRDVLCFCDSTSAAAVDELRAVVGRVWPTGDHLISRTLFRRKDKQWFPLSDLS